MSSTDSCELTISIAKAKLPAFLTIFSLLLLVFSRQTHATQSQHQLIQQEHWRHIQQFMSEAEQHADYWQWGWSGAYSVSLAFNLYQSSEADQPENRYDARVRSITSALGLAELFYNPLPHPAVNREIESLMIRTQNGDLSEGEALAQAETLFLYTAHDEIDRRSWKSRISSIITAGLAGLAIGIGDHRPKDGAVTFASSLLFKELQIQTLPTAASRGWDQYQPVELAIAGQHISILYAVQLTPDSLALNIRF